VKTETVYFRHRAPFTGASRWRLSEIVKRPLMILRIAIRIAMTFRNNNVPARRPPSARDKIANDRPALFKIAHAYTPLIIRIIC